MTAMVYGGLSRRDQHVVPLMAFRWFTSGGGRMGKCDLILVILNHLLLRFVRISVASSSLYCVFSGLVSIHFGLRVRLFNAPNMRLFPLLMAEM